VVEHLILFNAEASPEEVRGMVRKAQEVLLKIPGVCGLRYGEALSKGARYRYWLSILFEGPEVVPFYRDHPLHVEFADTVFRPMAQDRITTDYLVLTEVLCGK